MITWLKAAASIFSFVGTLLDIYKRWQDEQQAKREAAAIIATQEVHVAQISDAIDAAPCDLDKRLQDGTF